MSAEEYALVCQVLSVIALISFLSGFAAKKIWLIGIGVWLGVFVLLLCGESWVTSLIRANLL